MKKALLCILAVQILAVPCFADVLPTRRVERDAAADQAVQARLEQIGATPAEAVAQARSLTADESRYFARDAGRIQPAGRLYWYEWLIGAAVLGGVTATAIIINNEYQEQLD